MVKPPLACKECVPLYQRESSEERVKELEFSLVFYLLSFILRGRIFNSRLE